MRCGAVAADASAHFCLEGRCDSCLMEDVEGGGEPVRACQEPVPDDGRLAMRLWLGGGGGGGFFEDDDDDFWGDAGDDEEDEPESVEDPDDPFSVVGGGGGDESVRGESAGDAQEWESFEGSKYYRE